MTLTIRELEEIVKLYVTAVTEESRLECNKILDQWRLSNDFNGTALAIIQGQSNYESLILYVSYALINRIDHNFADHLYTNEDYLNIYNVCFDQIKNNPQTPPSNRVMRNIITLCAYSTFFSYNSALFDQFQQLSPNILIYYYDDLLQKDGDPRFYVEGSVPLFSNYDLFFDALLKAEICSQTFILMKSLASKCGITFISQFMPFIQNGLEKGNCTPSIIELFDEMKFIDPANLEKEEFPPIKDLIILLIDYSNKIDDTKLSSVIWDKIIDQGFDFFCLEYVGNDFTNFVFSNFQKSLQYFIENDIDEFYVLFEIYSIQIRYVPFDHVEIPKHYIEQMMPSYIEDFYQFVITLVNIDLQFCSDDISECLIMISQIHSNEIEELNKSNGNNELNNSIYIYDGFDDDDDDNEENQNNIAKKNENEEEEEESDNFYLNVLSQFYSKNLVNLSQGYIYAFSFAPLEIIKLLSSNIALQITSMSEPPPTTVYFVTKCCRFLPDSIDNLIQICFKFFNVIKTKDIGNALVSYSKCYPNNFISKLENYVPLIFEVIKNNNDLQSVMPYFIALFTIFPLIKDQNKETHELFSVTGGLFLSSIIDPTSNLDVFCADVRYIQDIIKNVTPGTNEMMKLFLSSLFDQVIEIFGQLMTSQDSIVQENLCCMISEALHNNWIGDREKILNWVNAAIFECPNEMHFSVLLELVDLLPTKEFKDFILKTDEMPDDLIKAEICFFCKAFKLKRDLVLQLPIDLFIFYLTKFDFYKYSFALLKKIVNCKDLNMSEDDVKKILGPLLHCFFNSCFGDDLPNCLKLIRSIAARYMGLDVMLQEILQIVGPSNEEEVGKFCQVFMVDPNITIPNEVLMEVSRPIIKFYRNNHQLE